MKRPDCILNIKLVASETKPCDCGYRNRSLLEVLKWVDHLESELAEAKQREADTEKRIHAFMKEYGLLGLGVCSHVSLPLQEDEYCTCSDYWHLMCLQAAQRATEDIEELPYKRRNTCGLHGIQDCDCGII